MEIFYATIIVTFILGYFGRYFGVKKDSGLIKINLFFFSIVTLIFILVCGLRSNIGDTYFYKHSYNLLVITGESSGYEKGFIELMKILVKISTDPQILIFTVAFICNLFILLSLKREATYFELSLYIFITSGYYLVTMNGMRQTMVAGVFFFFGIDFIKKRRLFSYIILLLMLTYFHKSVIFMLPVYFLAKERSFSKKMGLLIFGTLTVTVMFSQFVGVLKNISGDYGHYIDNFNEGGAHILRMVIDFVPVVLSYIYRDSLREKWKYSNIFINISVLNLLFMILALENWIFARISLYTSISNFILLPYIIKNSINYNMKKIIYMGCIICYFIYFYYDQAIVMDIQYRSLILGIF